MLIYRAFNNYYVATKKCATNLKKNYYKRGYNATWIVTGELFFIQD